MSVRGAEGAGTAGSAAGREGSPASERRASGGQRVHFEALVAVGEDAAGGGFEAESVDVSPDGMRLRTAYLPAVGDKLVCRFDGTGNEITAEGEVLWRNEEAKGGEFGLRFVGLDEATAAAVRAMCMTLGDPGEEEPSAEEPIVPRGSRVRLHIEGLGSPMKARVRESGARELSVGSNLEFLKVGRSLEIEDVDQGAKREATIDDVKVDVDPATNVPQLVVMLRFEKAGAATEKKPRTSAAPVTRRAAPPPPPERAAEGKRSSVAPKTARDPSRGSGDAREPREPREHEEPAAEGMAGIAARAAIAGRAVASKVGPVLAGVGARAKGAMGGAVALYQKRVVERSEGKKVAAPRRTTAPPPGGALTSDGRRLVRDDGMGEDEIVLPMRSTRHAAAMGGALGLLAVLAIFGAARFMGRGHADGAHATTAGDGSTAIAALPPAEPATAPGTPTAIVPLYGSTPLSTTEPAPGSAPSALASAAPSGSPAAPGADTDDDPEPGGGGGILKEWGQGTVQHPVVLKIKMDGAIEKINGAAGAMGFTISVPGRRSVSSASDLTRKDKRLASVNVVNTSHGAEISVQFKDGVPAYLAKVKGDRLEIAIGKEGHSKVAKKKKKKKSDE
jgi:PilZ domain